jgi:hypothetical protein
MKKLVTFTLVLGCMLSANFAYAQPANDDCANATSLTIAVDEASCAATTATTVGATQSTAGYVCSGSWFQDDVWFSFTTGATVPADGYTIKLTPGTTTTFGMALYTGCGITDVPFHCFSDGSGTLTEVVAKGLAASTTYSVRVWSGGSATGNSGTFDICVFNNAPDPAVVIWEDDFSTGLTNWTLTSSPTGADWVWMPIATAGQGLYADSSNVLNSPSAANGAAVYNSDFYDTGGSAGGAGAYPGPTVGELISPMVDCSAADAVGLEFSQTYRQYQSTFTVSYSTDGGNTYTDIALNTAAAVNSARISDRQVLFLNTAGGQDSVVVKFRFDADYYYWMLDDVRLTSLPAVSDLAIGDYVYPASMYGTPISQATANELSGFAIIASNIGSTDLTGVTAYATVSDANNNFLFQDSISVGTLDSGVDSIVNFPNTFVPDQLAVGTYNIGYAISSDSSDFNSLDNVVTRQFAITDSTFTNDAGATNASRPAGNPDYMLGNMYTMANTGTDDWRVHTAYFSAAKNAADGPLEGSQVTAYIVELADTINADLSNLSDDALFANSGLSVVGLGSYTFPVGAASYDDFYVPISNFTTGGSGVSLKSGATYFLLIEYAGASNVIFAANQAIDNGALGIGYNGANWFTGFAESAIVARMDISLYTSANAVELTNASLNVFPNPASDYINLDIEFDEATDASVFITDMTGRLVKSQVLGTITQERATIDVSDLAAGTYMVRLSTNEGFKVQRVVIAK